MYKTLFILATFSLLSLTVTASLSLPFKRSLQASNDGIIPITGPGNFVVSANLGSKSTNSTNSTSANMLLGLYTSRSLLASSCIGFTGYAPENYGYQASPNKSHISFLNFNVTGQFMSTNVVLDSGYWSLNTNGILATQCSSPSGVSYNNTGVWGVLGLGFANNSANNYAGSQPLFSIYIDQDGQSGELLFFSNLTKATTNVPLASLQTDSNWHITGLTNIVFNSSNSQTLDVSDYEVSFDLNSDAIGFPTAIYNSVIQSIQQAGKSLSCTNGIYLPTCTYNGNLDDLPVIQINAGGAVLPIYPEIYVANSSQFTNGAINGQITLNIKEVSSNLTGVNYVSSTYNDFIIMDAHVLTYFYVVFSGNSTESTGSVSVYIANRGTQGLLDEGNPTLYIVLGVVIVLLLAGASYWFFVRRTKQVYDGEREYGYEGRGSLLDDGLHSQL